MRAGRPLPPLAGREQMRNSTDDNVGKRESPRCRLCCYNESSDEPIKDSWGSSGAREGAAARE